jgi:hypothetical protein
MQIGLTIFLGSLNSGKSPNLIHTASLLAYIFQFIYSFSTCFQAYILRKTNDLNLATLGSNLKGKNHRSNKFETAILPTESKAE